MKSSRSFFFYLAIAAILSSSPAAAKDDPLEFLHRMEKGGFADIAVDYLNELKNDPDNAPGDHAGLGAGNVHGQAGEGQDGGL